MNTNYELAENKGNFYFVRKHDLELYKKLTEAESKTRTNLLEAGRGLRNALETFRNIVIKNMDKSDEFKKEVEAYFKKRNKNPNVKKPVLADYEHVFSKHAELRVRADLFGEVRRKTNPFNHEPTADEPSQHRTFAVLSDGFEKMQKLLYCYYTGKEPKKDSYKIELQPIDGYWICESEGHGDFTACERQVLCVRRSDRHPEQMMYRLVRQYAASDLTEDANRDEKVLDNLWNSHLRDPQNIVRYSVIPVTYGGDARQLDEKRLLCYDFGSYCPVSLTDAIAEGLNEKQKILLLHDMANGVRELHNAGVYHRNLQPDSVRVLFERDSDLVQARLVGFEYSKINSDARTVYSSVQKLHSAGDPSAYISKTLQTALKNSAANARIDWEKEDIYSLGALFHLVMTGQPPRPNGPVPELEKVVDSELLYLITKMLCPAAVLRPSIGEVWKPVRDYYRLVDEEEN